MSSALFLPSLPSPPLPSHRPPFPPLPLEVGPLNPARGSGERCKLPRGLGKFVQISVLIGLYLLKCPIFDQLILMKIIKIVATRCQILTLKCTKIDFDWGSAPDPAEGAYSAPPDLLAGFKGPTSKRRGG